MGEIMNFPETIEEFFKQYGFIDSEGIYTNRSELIHTFRAKQWDDNRQKEINRYKNIVDELEEWLTKNISEINAYFDNTPFGVEDTYKEVLNKLKELKGSDN